jgi:hypothetical protein
MSKIDMDSQSGLVVVLLELGSVNSVLNSLHLGSVVRVRALLGGRQRGVILSVRVIVHTLVDLGPVLSVPRVVSKGADRLVDRQLVVVDSQSRDFYIKRTQSRVNKHVPIYYAGEAMTHECLRNYGSSN